MAAAVAVTHRGVSGNQRFVDFTVTYDNSYPTGGEAVPAGTWVTLLGLGGAATGVQFFQCQTTAAGLYTALDVSNDKFVLFDADSEVADTSDQSTSVTTCRVWYANPS